MTTTSENESTKIDSHTPGGEGAALPTAMIAGERSAGILPAAALAIDAPLALHDGRVVRVRAIRPDDTEPLREFHTHLSLDSIIFRYFHLVPTLSQDQAEHLTHLDYVDRMALVATVNSGNHEQIAGVVRYERLSPTSAEVAFLVRDDYQRQGISTELFRLLAGYARARGIRTFLAEIMPSNLHMRDMLRKAGYPYSVRYEEDCVEMRVDISQPLEHRAA